MPRELLASLFRLLHRRDAMPDDGAIHDLDLILNFVAEQDNERGMRDAINQIMSAVEAAEVAQPGNYL